MRGYELIQCNDFLFFPVLFFSVLITMISTVQSKHTESYFSAAVRPLK